MTATLALSGTMRRGNPPMAARARVWAPIQSPNVQCSDASVLFGAALKDSVSFMSRPRKAMSEWVLHCEVNQRHIRRIKPTREAALKDACSQLLQGHAVNRIVGPNKTISAERIQDWCEKHRLEQRGSQVMGASK